MRVPCGLLEMTLPPPSAIVTRSGMRKLVLMPPISTPCDDSRGKPLTSIPTSVEVPPTSITSESELPVRNAAPRTLLAGPLPIVSTGYRSAWSRPIRVPSFCAKNLVGCRWCAASAARIASATLRATPASAPLSMVAFSRSSRPIVPISWLSETWISPSSRLTISAASNSCRGETGANTLVMTMPWAAPPTSPRNRAMASVSRGDSSRPSNSMPPSTTAVPTEMASVRSPGHPNIGRTLRVAGPPILITATRRRFRRSSTALVAWVVPSMTWVIRRGSAPGARSTVSIAAVIPPVISGVHGTLALAMTRSAGSMITASVLVPPTSMPRRYSGPGTGELLHWLVVEVVAEHARPGHGDPGPGPPDRIAGESDHRHPLPIPDRLGGDRVAGLAVQHRDQVGYRGQHTPALQRHQVLVLQLQPDQPARILTEALDHHAAVDEPTGRMPLDVQDLAGDQLERIKLGDQGGHWAAPRGRDRLTDPDRLRDRVPHGGPARLRRGERELRRGRRPAELDRGRPFQAFHPVAGNRPEYRQVAALVGHHGRAGRDPGQVHGDHGDLGERAAHAVGVHDRQPDPRGPGDGQHAVPGADLGGHQRRHPAPGHELQMLPEPCSLVPVLELFDGYRGGADPAARHDQRVIGQFVQIDQRGRAEVLCCLQCLQQCHVRIPPATCAEDGAAPGQGARCVSVERRRHGRPHGRPGDSDVLRGTPESRTSHRIPGGF